jgi:hypothetical protein
MLFPSKLDSIIEKNFEKAISFPSGSGPASFALLAILTRTTPRPPLGLDRLIRSNYQMGNIEAS